MPIVFFFIVGIGGLIIAYARIKATSTKTWSTKPLRLPKMQLNSTSLKYIPVLSIIMLVIVVSIFKEQALAVWSQQIEPNMNTLLFALAGIGFTWAILAPGKD